MKHFKALIVEEGTGFLLKVFGKAYTAEAFKATTATLLEMGAYGFAGKVIAVEVAA